MTASVLEMRCVEPGCKVAETGVCLNGREPTDSCPHFRTAGDVVSDVSRSNDEHFEGDPIHSTPSGVVTIGTIELPNGMFLDRDRVATITRRYQSHIIVLAGEKGVGKTTILTAIYEGLLRSGKPPFLFSGSETLLGFETRCHLSRESSGRDEADTLRTAESDELEFVHLRLQLPTTRVATDLLFTDVAGELFNHVANSSNFAKRLTIARHSTTFTLVLDGMKLCTLEERGRHSQRARDVLRSLLEVDVLDDQSRVIVVVNKEDCFTQPENLQYLELLEQQFQNEFGKRFRKFQIMRIAARPKNVPDAPAHGIGTDQLLTFWLEDSQLKHDFPPFELPKVEHPKRWFDFTNWPIPGDLP
jgi:GTPase SAR1 family protein